MSIVKIIDLVGESPDSWEAAAMNLVAEARATLRGITRIGIKEFDIRMKDNEIEMFRVRGEVSFRIER
ncbi:MAG: dodecin family protein [Anaerolineae bacterium]